jgi:hypothetical protein
MKIRYQLKDEDLVNLLVLIIIFLYLLSAFKPSLILQESTTTGGDTASHYYSAYFMKHNLLPKGKVVGWTQGNYGGFAIFQFYFFLPFLAMALLSYIIPLEISFKLISILGTFLLPLTAYLSLRAMRFKFPIPISSAVFMLPFLFMEANSMWGGNIPSTLAGEFSYSLSLSLTVLFLGVLYRELEEGTRRHLIPVLLLVMITFTHVYTLLLAVLSSAFFLVERKREKFVDNLVFLFKIYLLSFLLVAFWAVPMVWKLSYTTPFAVVWDIKGLGEVFPTILVPFYILALIGLYRSIVNAENRVWYISFSIFSALLLYSISTKLGIVDIRFIPFIQLFPLFISAYGFGELADRLKGSKILPLIAVVATILWINHNVTFIPHWIEWNYEGFENKNVWPDFRGVNDYLRGTPGDPRVVYEHSQLHNSAGSSRAFESLPLFSGRPTLEGLYMQSTVTSPFVFYIQSEISKVTSCPFPQWPCSKFNSTKAAKHMEMFNVGSVVARSDEIKGALKSDPKYEFKRSFGPYEVFDLTLNRDRYVVIPQYEPVLFETSHWKEISYLWFIDFEIHDLPLVFTDDATKDNERFEYVKTDGDLDNLPFKPIEKECSIEEQVSEDEIKFKTNCPGTPHILRISHFPNWMVEGADRIFLVSPSFMLLYPNKEDVRVYYGRTFIDNLGILFSMLGLIALLLEPKITRKIDEWDVRSRLLEFSKFVEKYKLILIIIGVLVVLGYIFIHFDRISESRNVEDNFGMKLAIQTERYTTCDDRIKDSAKKELCFKEVGILTNDYNLCDVRIENQNLRDQCFYEIGVQTNDHNLCTVKIQSQILKDECLKEVAIQTGDLNLCLSRISLERLKDECKDKIKK